MSGRRGAALGFALALALPLAGGKPAEAASRCAAFELKAIGRYAAAIAKCRSKAAAKGIAIDPDCPAKAEAKLAKAFGKAENKGDCPSIGELSLAQLLADRSAEGLGALLDPAPGTCCSSGGNLCLWAADATDCVTTYGGTPGAAGSVCHGDGQCLPPPALPGNCCEKPVSLPVPLLSAKCFASPTTILDQCASYGGVPSFSGVCLPSDVCAD
jgi:hypothetical protein